MSTDSDDFNGASASWIAKPYVLGGWDSAPIGLPIVPQISTERSAGIPQETSLTELVRLMMDRGCPPEMILMATALYEKNSKGIPGNSAGIPQESKDFLRAEKRREKDRERKRLAKLKEEGGSGIPQENSSCAHISISDSLFVEEKPIEKKSKKDIKSVRAKRISPDWQPTEDDLVKARELLPPAQIPIEIEKFRDYWLARGDRKAVSTNWSLNFRNWCRNNYGGSNAVRSGSGLSNPQGGAQGANQPWNGGSQVRGQAGRGRGFSAYAVEAARRAASRVQPSHGSADPRNPVVELGAGDWEEGNQARPNGHGANGAGPTKDRTS